jgi:D-3-phosphoglycerate dehydrogenase
MKILVTVPISTFSEACNTLNKFGEITYLEYPSYDSILEVIEDYDGFIPNARTKIDDNLLSKAKNLKVIVMPSMGVDHIDQQSCKKHNVELHCLADNKPFIRNIHSTSEYTLGLILSLLKKYPWSSHSVTSKGNWLATDYRGFDLQNKTIGIIGYGNIGSQLDKLLSSFEVKTLKYDPYIEQLDNTYVDLNTLLSNSDIISLHVPLTEETQNMINKEYFDQMNSVFFINASRGQVINDKDLIEALEKGNVKAAALDVLNGESPEGVNGHILVEYAKNNNNLLITPHCGGSSTDGLRQIFNYSAELIVKRLESFK